MSTKAPAIVRGRDGLLGTVVEHGAGDQPGPEGTVNVLLDDGRRLLVPARLLVPQGDGHYMLDLSAEEVGRLAEARDEGTIVVPVVTEVAEVGKRTVETGRVRVRKTVRSTEKTVNRTVFREEVEVERVPVNRMIDEPVGPRQEGETLIVPLLEEVLVVETRLMLREELRITRRRVEHRSPKTVTLRSEEATVERFGADRRAGDDGDRA